MIVVCGGIKGGSGKTTVAVNLTVLRSLAGSDVLLVDADDQETASDFTLWRDQRRDGGAGYASVKLRGAEVRYQLQRLKAKYEDIIVDTGGRDTTSQRAALTVADVVLVPFLPRSFDVWTRARVVHLLAEIRVVNPELRALAFLNRGDPCGMDNADAAAELSECPVMLTYVPDAMIGSRKAIAHAASVGLGVCEYRPKNQLACDEMQRLYGLVMTPQ